MAEFSPPLNHDLEIPDPIEAAQHLAQRVRAYEARAAAMLQEQSIQIGNVHRHFLETRKQALTDLARLLQTDLRKHLPVIQNAHSAAAVAEKVVFSKSQLEEFASGDIESCLGSEYAVYRGRRSPRIPNGLLLFMSRVTALEGQPGVLTGGSIEVEFDSPIDAWFIDTSLSSSIPNAAIMEIALQPCGFLSAWLHTPLQDSHADLYFRNLDGKAIYLQPMDLRGKMIKTSARLLDTTVGAGMILQNFAFDCSSEGQVFYRGEASFGYFPFAALSSQTGLDGAVSLKPWKDAAESSHPQILPGKTVRSDSPMDNGFSSVEIDHAGGRYAHGYIYGRKTISPDDWYFSAHFHQDPVMPGSLGVEALLSLLRRLISEKYPSTLTSRLELSGCFPEGLEWKYRGQVLPSNREMEFEVHLRQEDDLGTSMCFTADGSAWVDGKRIYDIKNLTISF